MNQVFSAADLSAALQFVVMAMTLVITISLSFKAAKIAKDVIRSVDDRPDPNDANDIRNYDAPDTSRQDWAPSPDFYESDKWRDDIV